MNRRLERVRIASLRVALISTGVLALGYTIVAIIVVLLVAHNLTSQVDQRLLNSLTRVESGQLPTIPVGVLHSPPYLTVGGENGSPWTKRTARFRKSLMRYEGEQLFPGDRTAPSEAAALLVIGMNIAPEHESDFNEWYNKEHIPALGGVPGTLCARRYRGTGATQRYVALYHFASPEVPSSAEWRKAADTPWTQRLRPHFRDMVRFECRRYSRVR